MSIGVWQLVIILIIVLILFGRGKISQIMGEFGKGIKSFKKEIKNQEQLSGNSESVKANKKAPKKELAPKINNLLSRHSSVVEHFIGNEEVGSSILLDGTMRKLANTKSSK